MKLFPPRRSGHRRPPLSHIDAVYLRDMGLNPDDFRDADSCWSTLLFTPFRDFRKR